MADHNWTDRLVSGIQANDRTSGNSQHPGTGDASAAYPISLWRSPLHAVSVDSAEVRGSALGAFSGSAAKEARLEPQPATLMSELKVSEPKMKADDRKLVRNGSMDLIVQHPSDVAERIRQLAEQMGGSRVSSETAGAGNASCAVMAHSGTGNAFRGSSGRDSQAGLARGKRETGSARRDQTVCRPGRPTA